MIESTSSKDEKTMMILTLKWNLSRKNIYDFYNYLNDSRF